MNIKRIILSRTRLILVLYVGVSIGIGVRLYEIQHGLLRPVDEVLSRATQEHHISLPAHRGNIYAEDGSLLAISLPFYHLAIDATIASELLFTQHIDSFAWHLSHFFKDASAARYKERIMVAREEKKRYLRLNSREISHIEKSALSNWPLVRSGRFQGGVIFDKLSRRFRPFGYLANRTIGHTDWHDVGQVGLEYSFDGTLSGTPGQVLVSRGRGGRWHPVYDGSEVHPQHGMDIETTLDVNIQDVVQGALLSAMRRHDAHYGTVVVMEVQSGEIKAMANLTRQSKGNYQADYNYAVGSQGVVEPGSTFKLASMMALLDETRMLLSDTVETGSGRFMLYGAEMRDAKPGGLGLLTAQEAFEQSSNIGIARLMLRHYGSHPEKFLGYLRRLAMDKPLGFQLKGEGLPYIKTRSDSTWSGTSLAWMSHGYELKLSPLQILTLYNAVANDGRMVAPLLVRRILNKDKVVESFRSRVIRERVASKKTIRALQGLLEGVVERGTAKNIYSPYCAIAGKTGTAKRYENGVYSDAYYCSFVGYFPADNP